MANKIGIAYYNCGSTCGVPQYSQDLSRALDGILGTDIDEILKNDEVSTVIYQCCIDTYSGRLSNLTHFERLSRACKLRGVSVLTMLHVVPLAEHMRDDYLRFIRSIEKNSDIVIVHSELARQQLTEAGVSKLHVVPHGCHPLRPKSPISNNEYRNRKFTIATFGTMRHEKGFKHVIEAARRTDAKALILSRLDKNNGSAMAEYEQAIRSTDGVDVEFVTDHLSNEDILNRLSVADCLVFAYPITSKYVATSGAIRLGMASGVPIVCTDAHRFSCLDQEVLKVDSEQELVQGITMVRSDANLRARILRSAERYLRDNDWRVVCDIYRSLSPCHHRADRFAWKTQTKKHAI